MICKLFVEKYWINTQCLLYIISYANNYPAGLCIVNSLGFIMRNISLAVQQRGQSMFLSDLTLISGGQTHLDFVC